jgi:hypothetical protein
MNWTKLTDSSNWVLPLDRKLIELCDKAGYRSIAVSMPHECVKKSLKFPVSISDSVFAEPEDAYDEEGRPAIWKVVKDLGIDVGCGNMHQKQIKSGKLTVAAYTKIKNDWHYIIHPDVIKAHGAKYGV